MLPAIQKQVNRLYVTSVQNLCDFALEAENVLEAECSYMPPRLPEHSMMPESAYKGQSNKANVSKTNNNNKPSQPNKPVVKVAATEEVKVDKTDLAHLVAS